MAVFAVLALTASATAQSVSLGPKTGVSAASSPWSSQPRNGEPVVEPASMEGMLAAQNAARQRIGLPMMTWSPELAAKAEAIASAEAAGKCNINSTEKTAAAQDVAAYWASGLRNVGGITGVQGILPSFLVSEWSTGRPDYDLARHQCRRDGACDQYAKMVSPTAHQVGCARAICPSQAQVWICRYDDSVAPSSPRR
jgi:pathogenesis-related protein 1